MNPIKLAVIGAGLIGQRHLELIDNSNECQLVAICDPNPSAKATAKKYNIPYYSEYRALLNEKAIDGAIIATPTDLHTQIGIACAEHGVHILVEKPIAATVADAQRLIDAAQRHEVQILVGHHRRHNPLVQQARMLIQEGHIGKLVAVSAHFLLKKPEDYFDAKWRTLRPGGGPALINVIHDIDNLRFICGDVRQVFAQMSSAVRGLDVEEALSVNITFANGALGSIIASDLTPAPWSYELSSGENPIYPNYPENCYYFCGTEGSLAFPQMTTWRYADQPSAHQPGVDQPSVRQPSTGWHDPLHKSHHSTRQLNPLVAQISHFCKVASRQVAPLISGEDAAKSLATVLAIIESAETGKPILL